jgi:hypothetical protein
VADDGGKTGIEDLLGNQPVGVGDVRDLEVRDEGYVELLELRGKRKTAGEDKGVPELDGIEMRGSGPGNLQRQLLLGRVKREDQVSHGGAAPSLPPQAPAG